MSTNTEIKLRQEQFQRLLRERAEEAADENYNQRFAWVCNSEEGRSLIEMMRTPEDPAERFDPAVLADAEKKFAALIELLPHEKGFSDKSQAYIERYLQETHPEGKKLYALILKQKAMKQQEEARNQAKKKMS